jgi:outer membrane autotransporter protein
MRSYTAYAAAKYTYPLTERSSVYGKLGLSHNARKVKSDTPGWNFTDSDNGLYAAAGVQTRLTEKVSLYAEYERNGKRVNNGSKNHLLNAGVKFDF